MVGPVSKKRSRDDPAKPKTARPPKKQRKQRQYHSDSDEVADDGDEFQAVNLLESDEEDLENMLVDDGATSGSDSDSDSAASDLGSEGEGDAPKPKSKLKTRQAQTAKDAPDTSDESDDFSDDASDLSQLSDGPGSAGRGPGNHSKSKRNDPSAFATSLSKILSTKLTTARRADPLLARSAAANEASRQALDAALESKARRRLKEQKRQALEKGRVRDVLVPQEGRTTADVLEAERRLRKVAQRGVVKLFNAVRAAQVKAAEAERAARNEGLVGVKRKEEKVAEMSKKGFLDLIASGGGGLKKGGLEEA